MKTLKKSLALVLALMMVVGVLAVGANAEFADAKEITPEYKEAVDVLAGYDIVAGIGNGNIAPKAGIERAQLAKILYEAYTGESYTKAANYAGMGTFKDVSANAWYAGVVNYAAYKGWIRGYGDGKFGPKDNVIGYDAITMILRMLGYGKLGELEGSNYRASAIEISTREGMLTNTDKNSVTYSAKSTREEVFEYLYKAMQAPTVSLADKNAIDYKDGTALITDNFGGFTAKYEYAVVTGVPAVYAALTTDADDDGVNEYAVYLNGDKDPVNAVEEFGPEYIGRVVKILRNGEAGPIFSMAVVSRDITVAKDATIGEGKDYKDLDAFVKGLTDAENYEYKVTLDDTLVTKGNVAVINTAKIPAGIYVVLDKDVLDKTIDGASALANGAANVVTFIDAAEKYDITYITVEEPADGKAVKFGVGASAAADMTDNELAKWYETNIGIDVAALDAGKYAVSVQTLGDITEYALLDVVKFEEITSVTTRGDVKTTFVADGKTYTALNDANVDAKALKPVVPAVLKNNETKEIVIFNGNAIIVDNMGFIKDAQTPDGIPAIDGFAIVKDARINVEVKEAVLGTSASASVFQAQIQLLLADGTEKIFNLDVKVETPEGNTAPVVNYYADPKADAKEFNKTGVYGLSDIGLTAGNLVAYKVNNGKIAIYKDLTKVSDNAEKAGAVIYKTLAKQDINGTDYTLTVNGADVNITKAPIVAKQEGKENAKVEVINGTLSLEKVTKAVPVFKGVYNAEKKAYDYTVVIIFADEYTLKSTVTPTDTIVYVDKNQKTEYGDKTEFVAYTLDGKEVTVTGGDSTTSGLFKVNSDNSIGGAVEDAAYAGPVAVKVNANLVTVGGTSKLLADGYKTVEIGGNKLDDNAQAYVHYNAAGEVDLIFVVA